MELIFLSVFPLLLVALWMFLCLFGTRPPEQLLLSSHRVGIRLHQGHPAAWALTGPLWPHKQNKIKKMGERKNKGMISIVLLSINIWEDKLQMCNHIRARPIYRYYRGRYYLPILAFLILLVSAFIMADIIILYYALTIQTNKQGTKSRLIMADKWILKKINLTKHPSTMLWVLALHSFSTRGHSTTSLLATLRFKTPQTLQPADPARVVIFIYISRYIGFLNHQIFVSVLKILYRLGSTIIYMFFNTNYF